MLRVNWNPATFNTIKICIEFMKFTIFSNFQFRVPKKYMSGLPYLKKPSWNYFKIGVILWNMVPKYENKCKISWEHDTRTFSFQALCASGAVRRRRYRRRGQTVWSLLRNSPSGRVQKRHERWPSNRRSSRHRRHSQKSTKGSSLKYIFSSLYHRTQPYGRGRIMDSYGLFAL